MIEAVRAAISEEMERDERVLVLGVSQRDIGAPVVQRLVDGLDTLVITVDPADQQPHALVGVAGLGVLGDRLAGGFY